jgi:hypothetical protein
VPFPWFISSGFLDHPGSLLIAFSSLLGARHPIGAAQPTAAFVLCLIGNTILLPSPVPNCRQIPASYAELGAYFSVDICASPLLADNFKLGTAGPIQSRKNNACIAAPADLAATRVEMAVCNGNLSQQWSRAGNATLELRLGSAPNMCLEVNGGCNDCPVRINPCTGTMIQKWFYDDSERLRPASTPSKCLAIYLGSSSIGAQLIIYDCMQALHFKWY